MDKHTRLHVEDRLLTYTYPSKTPCTLFVRRRTHRLVESPTPPPSAAAFPSLQMAAIPLDQYNGYSASAKGKEVRLAQVVRRSKLPFS